MEFKIQTTGMKKGMKALVIEALGSRKKESVRKAFLLTEKIAKKAKPEFEVVEVCRG